MTLKAGSSSSTVYTLALLPLCLIYVFSAVALLSLIINRIDSIVPMKICSDNLESETFISSFTKVQNINIAVCLIQIFFGIFDCGILDMLF